MILPVPAPAPAPTASKTPYIVAGVVAVSAVSVILIATLAQGNATPKKRAA